MHRNVNDSGTCVRCYRYVEQRDILMGTLTVREMLFYTARLRLPAHGLKNADDLAVANDRVWHGCGVMMASTRDHPHFFLSPRKKI
jgi:hypothetical protein